MGKGSIKISWLFSKKKEYALLQIQPKAYSFFFDVKKHSILTSFEK
jgi:hypothetical protein